LVKGVARICPAVRGFRTTADSGSPPASTGIERIVVERILKVPAELQIEPLSDAKFFFAETIE